MDANEFLNTLSDKGKTIVNECLPNFKKKQTFSVIFANESCVQYYDEDKYIIYLNTKGDKSIEYIFFHEFFHCVQYEEDFPNLCYKEDQYKEITNDISSYILDYNVRYRLEEYSYNEHIQEKYSLYNALLKYFSLLKNNRQISWDIEYAEQINYGMAAAMISIINNNTSKKKKLFNLIKTVEPNIYIIYKIFYQSLIENDYNSKEGVYKIFEKIIQELNLNNYISIKT